jgi:hypothetical protein
MVAGVQTVPTVWQLPQLLVDNGAVVCAFAPLVGRPARGDAAPAVSWQPDWVQLVDEDTLLWLKVAPAHLVVLWQAEHSVVVEIWVVVGVGVQTSPFLVWHDEQLVAPE